MSKFRVEWKNQLFPTIYPSKENAENDINQIISRSCYLVRKDFRIIKMEQKNKFPGKASQLPQGLHTPQETNEMIKSLEKIGYEVDKGMLNHHEDWDTIHLINGNSEMRIYMPIPNSSEYYNYSLVSIKGLNTDKTFETKEEVIKHLTLLKVESEQVILSEWRIATSKVQNFAQHLIKARDILNKGIESMEKLDLSFLSKESQVERNNVIKENVEYKKAIEKILNKIK